MSRDADIDLMRDVYMSREQRAAYERLIASPPAAVAVTDAPEPMWAAMRMADFAARSITFEIRSDEEAWRNVGLGLYAIVPQAEYERLTTSSAQSAGGLDENL